MEHNCCRKKERNSKEFNDLMNRLKRIEGQVRGLENMLENSAYCPDILVQVAAVNSALKSFGRICWKTVPTVLTFLYRWRQSTPL